ncbi:MAG: ATP-binding protein [candidate division WOR-3 bacterium]
MRLALGEELRKEFSRLADLQEGFWVADNEDRIVFANRALARLLGYESPEQIIGKLWYELLPVQEPLPPNKSGEVTIPLLLNQDGGSNPGVVTITSKTVNGSVLRFGAVVVPGRSSQSDILAMVAHELRTPLAVIKEALLFLAESAGLRLEEKERRYLEIAQEGVVRLNRTLDNLLEAARMETGRAALNLQPLDLSQLVETAIENLSLFIIRKGIKIERHISKDLPRVLGDRDRLLQVLTNLLDNAIKHSPAGGVVRIDIGILEPNSPIRAQQGVGADTDYLQVTVTDQGPGIPNEFLERIFVKYERVDPYAPGIGLGLAIVRAIIEAHQGKVWANSVLGEGASFSFVLPITGGDNE